MQNLPFLPAVAKTINSTCLPTQEGMARLSVGVIDLENTGFVLRRLGKGGQQYKQ